MIKVKVYGARKPDFINPDYIIRVVDLPPPASMSAMCRIFMYGFDLSESLDVCCSAEDIFKMIKEARLDAR